MLLLRLDVLVVLHVKREFFLLIREIFVERPRVQEEFAALRLHGLFAGVLQELAVMRHDQKRPVPFLQEAFEQELRLQIEKVRRLVQ